MSDPIFEPYKTIRRLQSQIVKLKAVVQDAVDLAIELYPYRPVWMDSKPKYDWHREAYEVVLQYAKELDNEKAGGCR